jgi:uncharacterized protein (DUF1330 family)
MQYLIWGSRTVSDAAREASGAEILASGEPLVLEGPWPFAQTTLAYCADDRAPAALQPHAQGTAGAFTVEGIESPGKGGAYVLAAHKMLDAEAFRPYAEAIPGILRDFGVRSLARGGKVTPLAGDFVPDRGVVLEFPSAESVVDFYTSDLYAPLLALRLRTVVPRFVVLSRSGAISAAARAKAEDFLRASGRATTS